MQEQGEHAHKDHQHDDGFEVVEPATGKPGNPHKGVYLLPNLFTTAALFAGFYAIVAAMNGDFTHAAVAIIVAGVLDGIDGGVARLTNTQSRFGAEFDSLSDCVAFGVAPGLVVYAWALSGLGNVGWAAAFIYVACAAMRLARFNVQSETGDNRYFTGLASPSAAGMMAAMVWLGDSRLVDGNEIAWLVALVATLTGLLMVSPVRYQSFKELSIGRVPFRVLLAAVLVLALISSDPPLALLVIGAVYVSSGPIGGLWRHWRGRREAV